VADKKGNKLWKVSNSVIICTIGFFSFLQQLSQFWYNDDTALVLAKEALKAANNGR